MKVVTIDCGYVQPRFAAAYLLIEGGEVAFVDNNTAHSVPRLMEALAREGRGPDAVRYLIVTHVHLDHAGGTSRLAQECRQAAVLAHPRAAAHLIDPARLVASARAVYGEETFTKLYGTIDPIPAERVRAMEDGSSVRLGGTELRFLHTRGHANHHFVVLDAAGRNVFTGDAFGLQYPDLQKGARRFILPSTSPTDFDPVLAEEAVERIVATGAERAYPTHFGEVRELRQAADELIHHLEFSRDLLSRAERGPVADADLPAFCRRELDRHYHEYAATHGLVFGPADWRLLGMDLQLNADGIAHVARKRRARA
jgi:glyoxylase-like metal-dependent hydrolase (beta-lactamase superfamily II)